MKKWNDLPSKTAPSDPPVHVYSRVPGRSPEWKPHAHLGLALQAVKCTSSYCSIQKKTEYFDSHEIWIYESGEWQYVTWTDCE